ncbi:MAG: hypothetical protein RLZZ142_1190 [Verrucomicrobiota bacterium]
MHAPTLRCCSQCERPLPAVSPGTLCSKCMLQRGLRSNSLGEASRVPDGASGEKDSLFPFDFGPYRVLRLLGDSLSPAHWVRTV